MPLILSKAAEAAWIDSVQKDGQAAMGAAQASAVTEVVHQSVISHLNTSRSVGAALISPFPNPAKPWPARGGRDSSERLCSCFNIISALPVFIA